MTCPQLMTGIDGLFLGKVRQCWPGQAASAISKMPVTGQHRIDQLGFIEDEQADPDHHGGPDKAIHHYASDHYPNWITEGAIPPGSIPAAFGENIATIGFTENTLCIGDRFRLGSAVVQISQGRQPCWKVSEFTANPKMAYLFQKTGRTGWYYRVIEIGQAGAGDRIELIDRCQPGWTVRRVTQMRLTRKLSQRDAETLSDMPELATGWRAAFARIARGDRTEDTSRRLQG